MLSHNGPRFVGGPAGKIWIDDGGFGELPVILAHSFAGSSAQWSAQVAHLRDHERAVAFDFRGHGQSAPPTNNDYSVKSLSEDLGAVIDAIDADKVVLVGHSMGGSAAIAYAGAHPQRVAGLMLVGTPGRTPTDQAAKVLASLEADYETVMNGYWNKLLAGAAPDVRSQIAAEMHQLSREASLAIIRTMFNFDPLPVLKRYPGPALDVNTPHGDMPGSLHRLLPDLPHREISGTSHWLHMDKPDEFNQVLDEFLVDTEARRGSEHGVGRHDAR